MITQPKTCTNQSGFNSIRIHSADDFTKGSNYTHITEGVAFGRGRDQIPTIFDITDRNQKTKDLIMDNKNGFIKLYRMHTVIIVIW